MAATSSREVRPATARPSPAARRFGYLLGGGANAVLIWLVNVTPGWWWVPFLTEEFGRVVWLITVSLLVGVAVNLGQMAYDPPWVRRLGDTVTAAFGVVIFWRLWSIFPFELGPGWAGWTSPLRVVLLLVTIGTAIGLVASLAQFLSLLIRDDVGADGRSAATGSSTLAGT